MVHSRLCTCLEAHEVIHAAEQLLCEFFNPSREKPLHVPCCWCVRGKMLREIATTQGRAQFRASCNSSFEGRKARGIFPATNLRTEGCRDEQIPRFQAVNPLANFYSFFRSLELSDGLKT